VTNKRGQVGEYLFQVAVAFDRLLNAVTGGSSVETLSSRAYRMRLRRRPLWTLFSACIDNAFFWQVDHCEASWRNECNRRNPAVEGLTDAQRK
jgi:hypothetical protein